MGGENEPEPTSNWTVFIRLWSLFLLWFCVLYWFLSYINWFLHIRTLTVVPPYPDRKKAIWKLLHTSWNDAILMPFSCRVANSNNVVFHSVLLWGWDEAVLTNHSTSLMLKGGVWGGYWSHRWWKKQMGTNAVLLTHKHTHTQQESPDNPHKHTLS